MSTNFEPTLVADAAEVFEDINEEKDMDER